MVKWSTVSSGQLKISSLILSKSNGFFIILLSTSQINIGRKMIIPLAQPTYICEAVGQLSRKSQDFPPPSQKMSIMLVSWTATSGPCL